MKTKMLKLLILLSFLYCTPSVCEDIDENDREKRTIGALFRTFVDAFQTDRQPAPMVVSFQPPRQSRPQAQTQQSQSTKADLLSSSKNIFQQKKNIFKPPATQAPDTEFITPTVATQAPASAAQPQVAPSDTNQPQSQQPNSPSIPVNSFQNFIPPQDNSALKAQILIIPFNGKHTAGTPFAGFDVEPRLPLPVPSPQFNYQAEIYLHPPQNGVHPLLGQHSTRYSPSNGWHDAGDILSRGIQGSFDPDGREEAGVINLSKSIQPEPKAFDSNTEASASGNTPENPTAVQGNLQTQAENDIASRRDSTLQYYEGPGSNIHQPLFLPHFQQSRLFNGVNYGFPERQTVFTPFSVDGFNYPEEEIARFQNQANTQDNNKKDETTPTTQRSVPKQVKGVNSIPPHRTIMNAHDYIPQRGGYQNYPDGSKNGRKLYEQSSEVYDESKLQYPEQQTLSNEEGFQQYYPTRIGKLPANIQVHYDQQQPPPYVQQGYQHNQQLSPHVQQSYQHNQQLTPHVQQGYQHNQQLTPNMQEGYQHIQQLPSHVLQGYQHSQEEGHSNAAFFDGQNYYKRSNNDQKPITKN